MSLKEELLVLKEKRARQFLEIQMLSSVNDTVYTRLGKTCAEIMFKEREILQETKNDFDEN
ncbi:hypothetical protein [Flavobacterium sp. T12S277]|uniref:hypothetical protein n=1 Tax=Flavobacterium sp. T12S277 TaxID=3402752 RepID=UPI003AEE3974